ncbi:hypothetical protein MMC07_008961 [Pseudocyphellaria aurata]|nr:hypothetical protein [Pseudocyphellaria aurata]
MEFRLLVETTDPLSQPSLVLEGRHWALTESLDLKDGEQCPQFACISYLWGSGREPHALFAGLTMSTRTRPSLAAAIQSGSCNAFWTDVFCVPRAGPERQSTLEHMGYIYSCATEVIIVLGEDTFSVIQKMMRKDFISESDLQILERDERVSSVWTYQEIVNGGSVRFVSERHAETQASIGISSFLNALGYGLWRLEDMSSSNPFHALRTFPKLNALENILVDWQTESFTHRSALNVFSSMSSKRNADPANYFYAILGVLTQSPQQLTWVGQNLAEKVMAICERKNDFSFIYTAAARDTDPRQRWRPHAAPVPADGAVMPAVLRPIFAWHYWGEAQNGHYDATGFWLHGMTIMHPAPSVEDDGRKTIFKWLHQPELQHVDDAVLGSAAHAAICSVGFEGAAAPIMTTEGLIFAMGAVRKDDIARVLVSNQIRAAMGAPGLVQIGDGDKKQYEPCIFIGSTVRLRGDGDSVLL